MQICDCAAAFEDSGWNGASDPPTLPTCAGLNARLNTQFDNTFAKPAYETSNALLHWLLRQAEKLTASVHELMNATPQLGS